MNKHERIPDSEKDEVKNGNEHQSGDKPMDAMAFINSISCPIAKSFMLTESPEY